MTQHTFSDRELPGTDPSQCSTPYSFGEYLTSLGSNFWTDDPDLETLMNHYGINAEARERLQQWGHYTATHGAEGADSDGSPRSSSGACSLQSSRHAPSNGRGSALGNSGCIGPITAGRAGDRTGYHAPIWTGLPGFSGRRCRGHVPAGLHRRPGTNLARA